MATKRPTRTPVRPPVKRTPVTSPSAAQRVRTKVTQQVLGGPDEADSRALVARVQQKTRDWKPADRAGAAEPMVIDARTSGLGQLIASGQFQITDEEFEAQVEATQHGDEPDTTWEELTGQMTHASCAFFAQEVLSGPPEPPYYGRFYISEHHEEWDDLINQYDRICVMAPRDHGKTYFFDLAYPIWKAKRKPKSIGFIFSATQEQAVRILQDIKSEIENNPKLQDLLPTRRDAGAWSATHIRLSNGSHVYARGFGTRVRGAHPDWIVVDDGLNDETAYSELVRRKQTDYFMTAITNMCIPGGQIIVVGTPFHMDDLYGTLQNNVEYEFRQYQAIQKDGTALWPERYSIEALNRRRREIGSIRFTREFQTSPVADDMSLFPQRLFQGDPVEQFQVKLGMPAEFWDNLGVTRFTGVDFALSSSVEADFTVVWTMGIDKNQNRWIVDIQREKGLPYQQQLSLINAAARKYNSALVFLEDNQAQRIFGDELIRTSDLPIKKFTTGVQKNALDKGVPSLRVLLENQKFRIPRGDAHSIEMTDLWINEMRSFTFNDGKLTSVGGHDDLAMACWICDQAIRHGGFQFTFGDEYEQGGDMDALMRELMGEEPDDGNGTGNRNDPHDPEHKRSAVSLVDPFGGAPGPNDIKFW